MLCMVCVHSLSALILPSSMPCNCIIPWLWWCSWLIFVPSSYPPTYTRSPILWNFFPAIIWRTSLLLLSHVNGMPISSVNHPKVSRKRCPLLFLYGFEWEDGCGVFEAISRSLGLWLMTSKSFCWLWVIGYNTLSLLYSLFFYVDGFRV